MDRLREPLVRRQGSQVSMRVARGSASWLSSGENPHGRRSSRKPLRRPCPRELRAFFFPLRQTQRSPEGPRHLHRIPRLSEAPWEVP